MGHKNTEKTQYNQALTTAQTPSPYEQRRAAWDNSILDAANSGDYTAPPKEARVFFNMFDPAERRRRRELEMGAGAQGTAALGAASPTALALDRQNRGDEDAEDAARGYQETWSNLVGGALADQGDLSKLDQDRRLGVLGATSSVYNVNQQKPKWWEKLLGTMAQNGQAAAKMMAGGGAGGFKDGGKWDKYIGKPVVVGEEGEEIALAPDGRAQVLGEEGPEVIVPNESATVIPADETRAMMSGASGGSLPEFLRYRKSVPPDSAGKGLPQGGTPRPAPTWVRKLATAAAGAALAPQAVQAAAGDASADGAQTPAVRPRRAEQPTPDEARAVVQRRSMPDPNASVEDTPSPVTAAAPSPRPTLPPAAVEAPGLDAETTATRRRWADPIAEETEHNAALHEQEAHPQKSSRLKALALTAMRGFLNGGPGGAIVGAAAGALDPSLPNAMKYGARAAQSDVRLGQLRGRRREDLAAEQTQAQTDWLKDRPALERLKLDAQGLQRERQNILAQIRARKGSTFAPDDSLLAYAEKLGMHFDAAALNNAASNVVSVTLVDPDHPEQTRRATLNKVTGELADVGQAGYVPPVGADGMTAGTRGSLALGSRRADETQRHDLVTESQGGQRIAQGAERIGIMRGHLSLAEAARSDRLDDRDRRDADKANKLAAQAERYAQAAESVNLHSKYIDPETGQEKESSKRDIDRDKLAAQAQALRRQLFSSYGDLFDQGPDGRVRMTTAQYRSMFPSLGGNYVGDAQSMGVDLTDADKTGQGTPVPSPIHRPAARASRSSSPAPSAGKTHVTRSHARRLYPQLKDASDADVDDAIRRAGYEPIP